MLNNLAKTQQTWLRNLPKIREELSSCFIVQSGELLIKSNYISQYSQIANVDQIPLPISLSLVVELNADMGGKTVWVCGGTTDLEKRESTAQITRCEISIDFQRESQINIVQGEGR